MTARPMTARASLIVDLRTDGEWLRTAKHATTEVVDAGNTMLKAAAEIERLSSAVRGMREALEPLVKAWDDYQEKASSARSEGQADAYYMLAKYLRADWERARAALSLEGGDKQARSPSALSAPISHGNKAHDQ